ncbi:hypothetical protein [Micromonospora sp. WMMD736]|uniref:hypothetical protein n=1 Tax=Micromonospora sp. WMMD736 TaxID=3404112 RepID=UPI003B95CA2C
MGTRLLLGIVLPVAGVSVMVAGLLVAAGYVDQPGPFNEAILGTAGATMVVAGLRGRRKNRLSGSGRTGPL